MANKFNIGDLEVLVVSDGAAKVPATVYFSGTTKEQWEPHKRWLDHEGNVEFPFSCFLVRSGGRTVLIDTGLGQINMMGFTGGSLLSELSAAGVKPEEIDTVFITHLHIDHCGTVAHVEGESARPAFPNATYRWTAEEQKHWTGGVLESAFMTPDQKAYLKGMFAAMDGRFNPVADADAIAPGVSVISDAGPHARSRWRHSLLRHRPRLHSWRRDRLPRPARRNPSGPAWATWTQSSPANHKRPSPVRRKARARSSAQPTSRD